MSYLVLARKYRPQTFEEVVGQGPVVRTLQNAIERNRVAHAMIFSGVRGVGKTTLARIVAKALNCKTGPTRIPCNQCESCREITAGTAIDLHEIDGASNRGIQEIRELKENIRFYPTRDNYKIIVIDEVHMLTTEAFNALLKTLEEPPAHVYFMFATTELHKIPITILSRCQRYELKKVPASELAAYFKKIAGGEGVEISDWAIGQIVREAGGSVRDGLSLLDQIFSFGGEKVTDDDVVQVLGLVDQQVLAGLVDALLRQNLVSGLEILNEIYSYGVDLKRFTAELLDYFRMLIICKISPEPEKLVDFADQDLEELKLRADVTSIETLQQHFQILLKGVEEMRYSTHPRLVLEMTMIKAVNAGMVVPVSEILEQFGRILAGTEGAGLISMPPEPPAVPGVAKPAVPETIASSPGSQVAAATEKPVPEIAAPPVPPVLPALAQTDPDRLPAEAEVPVVAGSDDPPVIKPSRKEVRKHWDGFIEYVIDRKKWMGHTLRLVGAIQEKDSELILKYDDPSDCRMLQLPENIKFLTEFAQDFFQKELKVVIVVRGATVNDGNGDESALPQEQRRALANDPLVQMTTEILGGRVINIRTGPRSR